MRAACFSVAIGHVKNILMSLQTGCCWLSGQATLSNSSCNHLSQRKSFSFEIQGFAVYAESRVALQSAPAQVHCFFLQCSAEFKCMPASNQCIHCRQGVE
jgi:hypothetical protein